jgi:mono/diheme cytochrome c family protein
MMRGIARSLVLLGTIAVAGSAVSEDPKIAYWLHCAGCHGLEGRGVPPDVPTLIDEPGRIEAVAGGREYLIRVPGIAQAPVSDTELAKVVNYMMFEFSPDTLSADFVPYSAEEVGRLRKLTLDDPLRLRAQILTAND